MRSSLTLLVALFLLPLYAQNPQQVKMAKEEAQLRARRALGEFIYGYSVQYRSKVSLTEANRTVMTRELEAYQMPGVKFKTTGYKDLGLIMVEASINKIDFIEAINEDTKRRTGQPLDRAQYQDLRFMYPDIIKSIGFGAFSENPTHPGRKYMITIESYKTEACVRLVNYLKGPTVSAVSRLENFFLTQDTIEAYLPKTLLRGAIFAVSEPNKYNPNDISLKIMITGSDWIFSVNSALEQQGITLTPDEYLKLKNRFARYPDKCISYSLPDDLLVDPNDPEPVAPPAPTGTITEPAMGTNEQGDSDILWK